MLVFTKYKIIFQSIQLITWFIGLLLFVFRSAPYLQLEPRF